VATKVTLNKAAREFLHFPVTGLPDSPGVIQVRFTATSEWEDTEWVGTGSSRTAIILVAGPDADPGTAVVLPVGSYTPQLRLIDDPEIVIRTAPSVILVR
jgi:hypothetical protein